MKKLRIKDIAEMANVSTATVSRVINHSPCGVGDATRERIETIIRETGYTPNLLAKSMITNKSYTIGLMSSNIMSPYFESVFQGINGCLRENGYNLLLCNSEERDDYLAQVDSLVSRGIDGMILVGFDKDMPAEIRKRLGDVPVVLFGYTEDENIPQINTNNEQLAYELTSLLVKAGHSRIGVITGPMHFMSVQNRLHGFYRAMQENGLEPDPNLILSGDFSIDSSFEPSRQLVNSGATAIFCFNDLMAYGTYKTCRDMGLRIPEDLSVVGFDELPYSDLMDPPLTTACQPKYETGMQGSKLLLQMVEGEEPETTLLILDGTIIQRNSVTAPSRR